MKLLNRAKLREANMANKTVSLADAVFTRAMVRTCPSFRCFRMYTFFMALLPLRLFPHEIAGNKTVS